MKYMWKNFLRNLYKENVTSNDLEKIKNLVSSFYKIPKEALDKVKVKYSSLPTICMYIVRRIGNYIQILYKPIAKVLGLYSPETKEVYIDRNLPFYAKIKTLLHEYVHAAQDYLGKLYRKTRKELEEEAHKVSDYLFKIYSRASQKPPSSLSYPTLI